MVGFPIVHALAFSLLAFACASSAVARETVPGPPLRFDADTFSFANQTVYPLSETGTPKNANSSPAKNPAFTLRCFAMCRSVEQFHKFARFDPTRPPPDDATLDGLLRRINRRAVWRSPLPPEQRVVIPGYASLPRLSLARR